MEDKKQTVSLNTSQSLYIIPCGDEGFTCLGFDICAYRTVAIREWLRTKNVTRAFIANIMRDDWKPTVGTLDGYADYLKVCDVAAQYCAQSNAKCPVELTPQLVGLEGNRVEVEDSYGETRRFIVGKSTGWMPCHLEIARRNSSGGPAVSGAPFKTVRVVGRGKY